MLLVLDLVRRRRRAQWLSPVPFGRNGGFIDTKTLPQDGIYRIVVDPAGNDVGSLTLTLYDVPPMSRRQSRPVVSR